MSLTLGPSDTSTRFVIPSTPNEILVRTPLYLLRATSLNFLGRYPRSTPIHIANVYMLELDVSSQFPGTVPLSTTCYQRPVSLSWYLSNAVESWLRIRTSSSRSG